MRANTNRALIAILLAATLCVAGCASSRGTPSSATAGSALAAKEMRIKVDRATGFAPLDIQISGVIRSPGGEEIPLSENERVRLQVETSHYRIVGAERSQAFHTAGIAEMDAGGLADPLLRSLKIQRPGTYSFQFILEDLDGNQLRSNTVQVKVI